MTEGILVIAELSLSYRHTQMVCSAIAAICVSPQIDAEYVSYCWVLYGARMYAASKPSEWSESELESLAAVHVYLQVTLAFNKAVGPVIHLSHAIQLTRPWICSA